MLSAIKMYNQMNAEYVFCIIFQLSMTDDTYSVTQLEASIIEFSIQKVSFRLKGTRDMTWHIKRRRKSTIVKHGRGKSHKNALIP